MKTFILTSAVLFIFINVNTSAQGTDSAAVINAVMGNYIDEFDNNYFDIFVSKDKYKSFRFYNRDATHIAVHIGLSSGGDTILVFPTSTLVNIRSKINRRMGENEQRNYDDPPAVIVLKNSTVYEGRLVSFSKKDVTMLQQHKREGEEISFDVNNISKVIISSQNYTMSNGFMGLLVGGLIGGVIGYAMGDDPPGFIRFSASDKALALGGCIGVGGFIVGLISGASGSYGETVIPIESNLDLLRLKNWIRYELK